MVIETSNYLNRLEANQFNLFTQKLHNSLLKTFNRFKGQILLNNDNVHIVKFNSATNVILCALKIKSNFKYITPKFDTSIRQLKIAITSASQNYMDESINLATRICELVNHQIVITQKVKDLFEQANKNLSIDKETFKVLKQSENEFLNSITDFTETVWKKNNFNVSTYSKNIPYSTAQVYRKLKTIVGKSPSRFLRDFRLKKALNLLHNKKGTISEIAQNSGFNSLTYFSKCFKERFGILPSKYIQQHQF